ncbi:MAG TPA: inositol monophosphatase family protein [Gaiellales bacterium]
MSTDGLLELALAAARDAGSLLLDRFGGPASGVESKSSTTDMVSDADRAAERLLIDRITTARPADGLLGEEGGHAAGTSGLRWVIDPLDGTTNYLFGYPVWSVSVACEDADGGVVAVVHDPCRGETFAAARGSGATLNGRSVGTRIARGLDRALVGTGFAYAPEDRAFQAEVLTHLLPQVRDIRRGGSAALDLAWVACGRLDGFYEWGIKHWDRAAGMLLVSESGGDVSVFDPGEGLEPCVVAAAADLYTPLRDAVTASIAAARGET